MLLMKQTYFTYRRFCGNFGKNGTVIFIIPDKNASFRISELKFIIFLL